MIPNIEWCIKNFNLFNQKYFNNELLLPNFNIAILSNGKELGSCGYTYGKADTRTRIIQSLGKCTITISDQYDVDEHFLQAILIHEMGHYYVNSVMGIYPRHAHGKEFEEALRKAEMDGWNDVTLRTANVPKEAILSSNGQELKNKQEILKSKKLAKPCIIGFLIYKDGHVFAFKTDTKYIPNIEKRYLEDRQWYEGNILGIDWYQTNNEKMKLERSQNAKISGWKANSISDFVNDRKEYYGDIDLNKISEFKY